MKRKRNPGAKRFPTLAAWAAVCLALLVAMAIPAGAVCLEAEDAEITGSPNQFAAFANGGSFVESKSDASGGSSVGYFDVAGNAITWKVTAEAAGETKLTFVLASGAMDMSTMTAVDTEVSPAILELTVNGAAVDYPAVTLTGAWQGIEINADLAQGENQISLKILDAAAAVNVDCLVVGGDWVPQEGGQGEASGVPEGMTPPQGMTPPDGMEMPPEMMGGGSSGTVLEAEDAEIEGSPNMFANFVNGGQFVESKSNASGGSSVGFFDVAGNKIIWIYEAAEAEETKLSFVVASSSMNPDTNEFYPTEVSPANLALSVNGEALAYDAVTLEAGTGTEDAAWQAIEITAPLQAGANTISLEVLDNTATVNVDCLVVGGDWVPQGGAGDAPAPPELSDGGAPGDVITDTIDTDGVILEAEDAQIDGTADQFASFANGGSFLEAKNASGGADVGFFAVVGNKITWSYDAQGEDALLTFVLASSAVNGLPPTGILDSEISPDCLGLTLNGEALTFEPFTLPGYQGTSDSYWVGLEIPVTLAAGTNTITLEILTDAATVNVDCLVISQESITIHNVIEPGGGEAAGAPVEGEGDSSGTVEAVKVLDIGTITRYIFIAVLIAAIAIAVYAVIRFLLTNKKKLPPVKRRRLKAAALAAALVVTVAANGAINYFNVVIGQFLGGAGSSPEEVTQAAEDITRQIESEGIVLLENKNNALPLARGTRLNVFGYGSANPAYGGTGSGSGDTSNNISLYQGLKNSGFELNADLEQFYADRTKKGESVNIFALSGGDYNIYEPAQSAYSDSLLQSARDFSDTAVIVFSRFGGEGGDLPIEMGSYTGGDAGKHYLELQDVERDLLDMVTANFDKVIVLINAANPMELGFLEEEGVDAALWIGGPGSTGFDAVGQVLCGQVTPSGRLVDTYAYDATSAPAYCNSGDYSYIGDAVAKGKSYKYLDYAEGIYVGYRYYETRWIDNETGECDETAYSRAVQYPFGYGLSYTTFDQEIDSFNVSNGTVAMKVKVTNTGDAAGKEVVQVYYTAPYTLGGIEKSHVVLGGFTKTGLLEPGASETVEVTFAVEDMASYDYRGAGCYVLEAGDYEIKLMKNAHEIIDSRTYTVDSTVTYGEGNARATDLTAAVNRFDDVSFDSGITYVSRADWEGTLPKERVTEKTASAQLIAALDDYSVTDDPNDQPITTGANNGLTLSQLQGKDYDDPMWDDLLDQMTIDEMKNLIGYGAYSTRSVSSVGKPETTDLDGPAGLNSLTGSTSGVQYTQEVVLAATWNVELAQEMGRIFGQEANTSNVSGVYAPAVNIHRTPFSGRNFEYYSEDGLLSGKMGASVVSGFGEEGVYCYVKHFAVNDQETNRVGVAVWCNEQAMREIYLKPFELTVKEGGTTAIMSSMNRLGTTWTGASYALLTEVLRNEWGFQGMVITDYVSGPPMTDVDGALRAGNDLMLTNMGQAPTAATTGTATGQQAMRRACKNILYTVVNSSAFENMDNSVPVWIYLLAAADVVILVLITLGFTGITGQKKKKEKAAVAAEEEAPAGDDSGKRPNSQA